MSVGHLGGRKSQPTRGSNGEAYFIVIKDLFNNKSCSTMKMVYRVKK